MIFIPDINEKVLVRLTRISFYQYQMKNFSIDNKNWKKYSQPSTS